MIDASGPASEVVIRHHSSNDGARSGTASCSSRTSANFASVKSRSRWVASPSENGPGDAGRGHRLAELLAQHVEHEAQPRVAVTLGPDGDRGPTAGLGDAARSR